MRSENDPGAGADKQNESRNHCNRNCQGAAQSSQSQKRDVSEGRRVEQTEDRWKRKAPRVADDMDQPEQWSRLRD